MQSCGAMHVLDKDVHYILSSGYSEHFSVTVGGKLLRITGEVEKLCHLSPLMLQTMSNRCNTSLNSI